MENSTIKVTFEINLIHTSYTIVFKIQKNSTNNVMLFDNDHRGIYQLIIESIQFLNNRNKAINFLDYLNVYNVEIHKIY